MISHALPRPPPSLLLRPTDPHYAGHGGNAGALRLRPGLDGAHVSRVEAAVENTAAGRGLIRANAPYAVGDRRRRGPPGGGGFRRDRRAGHQGPGPTPASRCGRRGHSAGRRAGGVQAGHVRRGLGDGAQTQSPDVTFQFPVAGQVDRGPGAATGRSRFAAASCSRDGQGSGGNVLRILFDVSRLADGRRRTERYVARQDPADVPLCARAAAPAPGTDSSHRSGHRLLDLARPRLVGLAGRGEGISGFRTEVRAAPDQLGCHPQAVRDLLRQVRPDGRRRPAAAIDFRYGPRSGSSLDAVGPRPVGGRGGADFASQPYARR